MLTCLLNVCNYLSFIHRMLDVKLMNISRIYTEHSLEVGGEVNLEQAACHHLINVLRVKPGNEITLFNGLGGEYRGKIVKIAKKSLTVLLEEFIERSVESPLNIHLIQGISRGEKMDFSLQKSVELGVKEITPVITSRCGVKLSPERMGKKLRHWQQVIISACEQSGRNYIPKLNQPLNFNDWVMQNELAGNLILDPHSQQTIRDIQVDPNYIGLCIGSEGGFSSQEIELAKNNGLLSLSLGPRILRTETAALATISALQVCYGDFG